MKQLWSNLKKKKKAKKKEDQRTKQPKFYQKDRDSESPFGNLLNQKLRKQENSQML